MTWAMTLLPVVLLVLGFPIFVILLATSAVVIVNFYSIPPTALHQVMFGALDSSALLAVPFFIFAGEIMGYGGISRRLVDWTKSLLGGTKASLPITTVGTCVVFGAISGSSAATVAAVGRITFKPMVDAGYDVRFATGLITASGLIDNMIPPAIAMILYAAVAEQSLVRIFTAGFVPGLLFALAFAAYILVKSWRSTIDPPEPFRWRRLGRETSTPAGRSECRSSSSAASMPGCSRRPRRAASPASTPSWSRCWSTARRSLRASSSSRAAPPTSLRRS